MRSTDEFDYFIIRSSVDTVKQDPANGYIAQ